MLVGRSFVDGAPFTAADGTCIGEAKTPAAEVGCLGGPGTVDATGEVDSGESVIPFGLVSICRFGIPPLVPLTSGGAPLPDIPEYDLMTEGRVSSCDVVEARDEEVVEVFK